MTTIIARNLRTFDSFRNKVINEKLSMIPTMGALHEGHIALIRKAKEISDLTVVTIFVNPKQFSNKKDLETYPSSEKSDIKILQKLKVDLIYIPKKEDIYTSDYSTYIKLKKFNDILCAARRKNHFNGVATILTKLFFLIRPDYSLFGEKDYQQLIIIKKLVKDFSINTKILAVKTIRDNNGLALSSRNFLLNALEYNKAKKINKILKKARKSKFSSYDTMLKSLVNELEKNGLNKIEYIEIRDEKTLRNFSEFSENENVRFRIFIAIRIGKVRLIDNLRIS